MSRSVRLNNYHNWQFVAIFTPDESDPVILEETLRTLALRDEIMITEERLNVNNTDGWSKLSPGSIKRLNPDAKVYKYTPAFGKSHYDTCWGLTQAQWEALGASGQRLTLPIPYWQIDDNDWWLRDSEGTPMLDPNTPGDMTLLDLGGANYKETFVTNLLDRLDGEAGDGTPYDGIVLDYCFYNLESRLGGTMPAAYPTDADWWVVFKAFADYVADQLIAAGYDVLGNDIGVYDAAYNGRNWVTNPPVSMEDKRQYLQDKFGAACYETSIVSWNNTWRSGINVEKIINSLLNDSATNIWIAEAMIRFTDSDFAQRSAASLAMYYCGIPQSSQANRSYSFRGQGVTWWHGMFDHNIGVPVLAQPTKVSGRYTWLRNYTNGLVCLNHEATSYELGIDGRYRNIDGSDYTPGTYTVPAYTGLILRKLFKPSFGDTVYSTGESWAQWPGDFGSIVRGE